MKWVMIVGAVIVSLAVIVALVGAMLPRNHKATSVATLRQPIDTVWAAVRNIGAQSAWWPGVEVSERLADVNGRERWHTKGSGWDIQVDIIEDRSPSRLVTEIVSSGAPFGGRWIYELSAAGGGTRVSVTEDGWVSNVIFRFMSRFVMGHYTSIDGYLSALGKKFGETVKPTHAL